MDSRSVHSHPRLSAPQTQSHRAGAPQPPRPCSLLDRGLCIVDQFSLGGPRQPRRAWFLRVWYFTGMIPSVACKCISVIRRSLAAQQTTQGCSSLREEFRTSANWWTRGSCCHRHFCASGCILSVFQRRAKLISSVAAGVLTRIRLYATLLTLPMVNVWPKSSQTRLGMKDRIAHAADYVADKANKKMNSEDGQKLSILAGKDRDHHEAEKLAALAYWSWEGPQTAKVLDQKYGKGSTSQQ
eukprot:6200273-Pleurochrysis_carterae.AAC.2